MKVEVELVYPLFLLVQLKFQPSDPGILNVNNRTSRKHVTNTFVVGSA